MNVQYVFIDSGIGGLPYLKRLMTLKPNATAAYVADTKNFPYGTKTDKQLKTVAVELVKKIIAAFNPQIITIACNTLSVGALQTLRENFLLPFVGTVPAVKVASKLTKTGRIVLIASEKAAADPYTKNLIDEFSSPENFILKPEQTLIKKIEEGLFFESEAVQCQAVKPIIDYCIEQRADCLVLGCTHFLIVEEAFKHESGGRVRIVESLDGVVNQTMKLASKKNIDSEKYTDNMQPLFFTTGKCTADDENYYQKVAKYFGLQYEGVL